MQGEQNAIGKCYERILSASAPTLLYIPDRVLFYTVD